MIEGVPIWQRRQHQIKQAHRHKVIGAVCQQTTAFGCAKVKKPGNYRGRATEKSQQQETSSTKQAGPGKGKHCFFTDVDGAAERNEPAKCRDQRTVQSDNSLSQLAADQTLARAGKQVVPVSS
jgi:hypothetical protein